MSIIKKDITEFLKIYHKFKHVTLEKFDCDALYGKIDVVDIENQHWKSYTILITIKSSYPYTIPLVYEMSENIKRDWDYHISKDGYCCLDITHELILRKRIGINIIEFYREVIYPFFANHQYRVIEGEYANGEYKHFDNGVIQYYEVELGLTNQLLVVDLIKEAIKDRKLEPNKTCPICGNSKHKKCCGPKIKKLRLFGKNRLENDLKIFESAKSKIQP